jgi:anaerobic selenocysteine-containing dehydrogenase
MMTIRSHDQFNTTIYGLDDRYRGVHNGRRVVFLNANDIRLGGYQAGQVVDLISNTTVKSGSPQFSGGTVQYSATVRRDLFPGSECFGAGEIFCGQKPHAGFKVGGD